MEELTRFIQLIALSLIFTFTFLPSTYSQGPEIGEAPLWLWNYAQYWRTVKTDPNQYKKEIKGTIVEIRKVPEEIPYVQDGDWNIFVDPDSDYSHLLKNSFERPNCGSQEGTIELEIKNSFAVKDFFKAGDKITAFGWWVEDYGHTPCNHDVADFSDGGGKTELHPFHYIYKENPSSGQKLFLFMQDMSNRFYPPVLDDMNSSLSFQIPYSYDSRCELRGQQSGDVQYKSVTQMSESMIIDRRIVSPSFPEASAINIWNDSRSTVYTDADLWAQHYNLNVRLKRGYFTFNPSAFLIHEPSVLLDYTFKEIQSGIEERVSARLVNTGYEKQRLIYEVTITYVSSPVPEYIDWIFETSSEQSPFNSIINTTYSTVATSTMIYDPNVGAYNNEWSLTMKGSSVNPALWKPGLINSIDQSNTWNRDRFFFTRDYHITPSSMTLEIDNGTLIDGAVKRKFTVTPKFKTPHIDVGIEPLAYSVRIIRYNDGTTVGGYAEQPILSHVTIDNVEVTKVDNTLELFFPNNLSQPQINQLADFHNNTEFLITAFSKTYLGEPLFSTIHVSGGHIDFNYRDNLRVLPEFKKLLLVCGLLGGEIPEVLSKDFQKQWEKMRINPQFDFEDKSLLKNKEFLRYTSIIDRVVNKKMVEESEIKILSEGLKRVSNLPKIVENSKRPKLN